MLHPQRFLYRSILVALVLSACAKLPAPETAQPTPTSGPIINQRVTFQSDGLTLVGYLSKPAGDGPFPALIWNHGSEHDPNKSPQDEPSVFVKAGYVEFAPLRRGHGDSEGEWIGDTIDRERSTNGRASATELLVKLMETEQLDDQMAGLAYLKSLPYVDLNRLAVGGCSYGGIQTLLAAERGEGYKAAVAMSPAAQSWEGNKPLQDRLIKAVSGIDIPVFLIHPAKDASLEPGITLGNEFERLGKIYQLKIFPEVGTETQQGHCFGGPGGTEIWQADVLAFFAEYLR